ncbi:MAG: EAL domain-containing protein [Pseudomonadota bacterium]
MNVYHSVQPVASILVVDDEPSNIQILREAVRDMGEVYFATNGESALELIHARRPDVVLLDIEMPGMDGYAVCKAIKADPLVSDTAIIFVTSHESHLHELQALSYGGVDFVQKPFNVPIARARIQTHLSLQLKTRQLVQARRDLADVVTNIPAFVAHWNNHLVNCFCNDNAGHWFGVTAQAMNNKPLREILGENNFQAIQPHIDSALHGENPSFDMTFERNSNAPVYGQVSLIHRRGDNAEEGFLMLITDVTERKLAEIALFIEKERLHITLNSIGDAVIATDQNGIVSFVNPIAESLTGWLGSEALGKPIEQIMPLREGTIGYTLQNPIRLALKERRVVGMAMNCMLQSRAGDEFEVEDSAAPIYDHAGELTGAIIVFHDVSEARAMAIKMTHLANHDALTNLPNRMLLHDRTEQALHNAQRSGERVAMILLDIDHFKTINDSLGHSAGDEFLQKITQRLKHMLRAGDTISRQGGDEFIILLTEVNNIEQIGLFANRVLKTIAEPYWIGANRFDLSASLGISLYPDDSEDREALYRHADAAMYLAKREGRNRYHFFSAKIEDNIRARLLLEHHLRDALERGVFEVFYQPKIDSLTQAIVGAEALVRWRDPNGNLISPMDFIPLAEETGIIIPLGLMVLRRACMDAKTWHHAGFPIPVAINISAVQFSEDNFVDEVAKVLNESGIDFHQVEFEITEGILAKNIAKSSKTIAHLKELGLKIAIDDFGTGYSSLSYLKGFPLDVLKIDQSFIRDMIADPRDAAIVTAIIHMAKGLNLKLVAEGVETQQQADILLAQGCNVMQGFLYSRPVPYPVMTELLRNGISHSYNE